ncbi:integrase core domain-containing protein [Myxococcota bacterium]
MASIDARKRPHYRPTERLAILELRAARGWSMAQTARALLVQPATIASWCKRIDEEGDSRRCSDEALSRSIAPSCGLCSLLTSVGTTSTLKNHSADIWACDFLQLYDVLFRPIFAFFIIKHESREVVHLNVTRSPSDEWVAQQLREATSYGQGPKYLIRDKDDKFGAKFTAAANGAVTQVVQIPPKSRNLNPICERFLGSVRRECLDHILILSESHPRRVVTEYGGYFNRSRPHQGIHQRIPADSNNPGAPNRVGRILAKPVLSGLHHDYRRVA